ncbi:hypothetical protein SETIT_4G068200v2 [Setaria italica]|uniref:BTB domain-containing protein n=1 Tax=Setaria italica TaxID=4555 RepID=K3Y3B7_SETIT|nr:hypothetical protein SETIT_4G068200v2 [Setaria italica]
MAASERPRARTASTCSLETARGTHAFKISDYISQRGLVVRGGGGRFIQSAAFAVGAATTGAHMDYAAVYLELVSKNAEIMATFDLRLVDQQATGQSLVLCHVAKPRLFTTKAYGWGSTLGTSRFKKKSHVIECDVTVVTNKKPWVELDFDEVPVPPSDLSDNLGKLLVGKKGADVTFKVGGEAFPAHRIVLAMRSPVFEAELYGPMEEKTSQHITVQDMQPDVFRALLHFIYADSMPGMEDRYDVRRLKQICEGILCKSPDVENVATILALADQHHCNNLRNACVEFIAYHRAK